MEKYDSVDSFIAHHKEWHEELTLLRRLMSTTQMNETVKWGFPVYTVKGKNVIGLGAFKSYVGIWFFQGVFLNDQLEVLVNAQEGKTKAMRQWRFSSIKEIDEACVVAYVQEAIANQEAGKEVKPERKPLVIPDILMDMINMDPDFAQCFNQMSLTCKREYAEYISEAKREATKQSRLQKIKPMIMSGVGLNDKYRS